MERYATPPEVLMFGGSGHAGSVIDVLVRGGCRVAGVVDPAAPVADDVLALRSDEDGIAHARRHGLAGVVGIGDNGRRLAVVEMLREAKIAVPVIVARTASVAQDAVLGPGTIVLEHAHVGPGAELGTGCLVNTGAIVEHDCRVGAGVHCAPGAVVAGGATCGARVLIGANAAVLPLGVVGDDATVGAGAVVTTEVPAGATAVGVPAHLISAQEATRGSRA